MKLLAAFVLCSWALVLVGAEPAGAAEPEWDQVRVTALAREMAAPIAAIRADLEGRPPVPGKEAAHATVLNDVKALQSAAGQLAQRLASGAARSETASLFVEVKRLESQAAKGAAAYPAPFDMHTQVERLDAITNQLGRYYGTPASAEGPR